MVGNTVDVGWPTIKSGCLPTTDENHACTIAHRLILLFWRYKLTRRELLENWWYFSSNAVQYAACTDRYVLYSQVDKTLLETKMGSTACSTEYDAVYAHTVTIFVGTYTVAQPWVTLAALASGLIYKKNAPYCLTITWYFDCLSPTLLGYICLPVLSTT